MSGNWTEEQIQLYKDLGETCLKYPTSSDLDNEIVKEYYIHSHGPFNKYYFVDVKDFEYTGTFCCLSLAYIASCIVSGDKISVSKTVVSKL